MEEQLPEGLPRPPQSCRRRPPWGSAGASVSPPAHGRASAARSSPALRGEQPGQNRPVTFRSEEGSLGTPWQSALPKR